VASTMAYSISGSSETASNMHLKTSAFTQSRKRLNTVFRFANIDGRSRHGLAVGLRANDHETSTPRKFTLEGDR